MLVERPVKRITTTIKREFLAEIVAGSKTTEYRDLKPYWAKRLEKVAPPPFEMRLINGMRKRNPEVTVLIDRVTVSRANGRYQLHIAKVLRYLNWDKRQRRPK